MQRLLLANVARDAGAQAAGAVSAAGVRVEAGLDRDLAKASNSYPAAAIGPE
jgi:hypothetical protein